MNLQEKLNKAKKIASSIGKDLSNLSAFRIANEMNRMGYFWDSKVATWTKLPNISEDEQVKTVQLVITAHPLVMPDFLALFNEFLSEHKEMFSVKSDQPSLYPITNKTNTKLAGMGFNGASYKLVINDTSPETDVD